MRPFQTPAPRITAADTPLVVVAADTRLQDLLANPPKGHGPDLQDPDWYERVFDLLACTHPEACTCAPTEVTS